MEGLYRRADAYVTASYGEGFGGPVVEALLAGTPVIAPRHTGLADLLPEGYPLVFGTDPLHVGLRGNPPVYPHAASWLVPRRGEIQRALDRFCAFGPAEAAAAAAMGKRGVENFCSPTRVRAQLDAFWSAVGAAFAD
jgi:glycosyltransferase involved in cell wall biosynthesis